MANKKNSKSSLPLEIKNLSKKFKDKTVLENISMEVGKGEIFGLIGLNGVGKTTMIKIILGLLDQDSGETKIYGQDAKNKSSRKNLSFLPEKFFPSGFLKGEEFLKITCSYYKKPYKKSEAIRLAEILRLDPEVLGNRVSSYSKGMGQKLGLLSSFLVGSPFLMLDEPMSGLDPSARISLKDALKEYVTASNENTIFFSSHILSDIDEICDRIAILHDKKIIYQGTPSEFKKKMKNSSLERAFLSSIEPKKTKKKSPITKSKTSAKKKTSTVKTSKKKPVVKKAGSKKPSTTSKATSKKKTSTSKKKPANTTTKTKVSKAKK